MENASKALLMAGGILIALLVISALILMFNQIGAYGKSQEEMKRNSQLVEFNKDFERYMDDKGIDGTDIISLINKVIDYNNKAKKGGVENSVDYSIKMSITVSGLDTFNSKYGYNGSSSDKLFKKDIYVIGNDYNKLNNELKEELEDFVSAEKTGISRDLLKQLSGMYDKKQINESIEKMRELLVEQDSSYQNWDGTTTPTIESIKKYTQYSEFKTSKFRVTQDADYENGQIKNLYFEFYK